MIGTFAVQDPPDTAADFLNDDYYAAVRLAPERFKYLSLVLQA